MKRSTSTRGRKLAFVGIALCLCLTLATIAPFGAAASGSGGAATVQGFYNTLLATMRNGPALGPRGRYAAIAPIIRRSFDIPFMTRLAVGSEWAGLSDAQRQQVSQAFERYITAVYADRFDNYSGEQLQVLSERPAAAGTIITSRIVKSNGEPVNINYLMRDNGGQWQIADVYLDGTISELATRRSEFADILRRSGIDGLIQALNTKADVLTRAS
jgi:phospholipid transport system substrate-binding protein